METAKNCNSEHAINGELQGNQENKREKEIVFYKGDGGGGSYKQIVHWGKLEIQSVVAFHSLSGDTLSLATLLPDKKKVLSFCWVVNSNLLTVSKANWHQVVGHESSPFWSPDPILNEVSVYWFSWSKKDHICINLPS